MILGLEWVDNQALCFSSLLYNQVSEVIGNMNHTCMEENKRLELEMSGMQQVSDDAVKEWIAYTKKAESQFQEDTC